MESRSKIRRHWHPFDSSDALSVSPLSSETKHGERTIAAMRDIPCLVLLGAPGMGKSHEAAAEHCALAEQGEVVDLIEVRHLRPTGPSLANVLTSPAALAWRTSGARWTLLVDGVDEYEGGATAFVPQLAAFLERLVAAGDLQNFRLRLFCRTIEWTDSLDDCLSGVWPDRDRQIFQLAPLRDTEILAMAELVLGSKTDAERFVISVNERKLEALAARPVSFRMLINLFYQHKTLPKSQSELFYKACAL